ncbi:MAG: hypothetical protein ACK4QP_15235 [Pseudorhizobium sp.]
MTTLLQRERARDLVEALPSLVFVALLRSDVDLQVTGWVGAALAGLQLIGFRYHRLHNNPIMLGINIHLLLITPSIMITQWAGAVGLSDTLLIHSYHGVLVTVFLVGCLLTVLSRRGFIGTEPPQTASQRHSLVMVAASGLAVGWGFAFAGSALVAVAIPLMVLFGLRRLLIARICNGAGSANGVVAAGAGSAAWAGACTGEA